MLSHEIMVMDRIHRSIPTESLSMLRYILLTMGILLAFPVLGLAALAFRLPITISGALYLLAALLTASGLILAPRFEKCYVVSVGGVILLFLVVGTRLLLAQASTTNLKVIALPHGNSTSWLNSVIDEQDALVFGEAIFHRIGGDSKREHENLDSSFAQVYARMRNEGSFSSPIVSTYLNLQHPDHFDAVIVEPEGEPQFGLVFLHGYMGNVTAQCWVIAQAVKNLGGVTICPSTVWTGEWWRPDGRRILENTFSYLRERGIDRIYLGGFSNGGFGIGRLASQLKEDQRLAGLIFIDGFINGEIVRDLVLPVLIIEGTQDERVPIDVARQFAREVGDLGSYVQIDSDHFLIMKEPGLVQQAIATWLNARLAGE